MAPVCPQRYEEVSWQQGFSYCAPFLWDNFLPVWVSISLINLFKVHPMKIQSQLCVSLSISFLSSLFIWASLYCCTFDCPGTSLTPLTVGALFQMFWICIAVLEEIWLLSLSRSVHMCVCSSLLHVWMGYLSPLVAGRPLGSFCNACLQSI